MTSVWEVIDEDNRYVTRSIVNFDTILRARQAKIEAMGQVRKEQLGVIIAKVGINAINHSIVKVPEDPEAATEFSTHTYWNHEFRELPEHETIPGLSDGTVFGYGQVSGEVFATRLPMMVINRLSGPASLYFAHPTPAEAA